MVLLEFSVFPVGKGESLSPYVAQCVQLVEQSGLPYELNAMGTIVEGELDDVLAVMRDCVQAMAQHAGRVSCSAKLDYRDAGPGRLTAKVQSVRDKLVE